MSGDPRTNEKGQPSLGEVALFGLCPKCGAKTLFAGPVRFAARCRACGLDYATFNVGDGPAAFLTLIVGGLIAVLAIWVQLAAEPPFWVHIVLWVPLTTLLVVGGLRLSKAALLASEYRNRAREAGRDDVN
ncbi:MAG: DUF983 domain-containing protein [Novosphingobium sp.]|nr:DUF983 domain-containing protein [Novosphingobium sp.]